MKKIKIVLYPFIMLVFLMSLILPSSISFAVVPDSPTGLVAMPGYGR
jgi:hypothetical protein